MNNSNNVIDDNEKFVAFVEPNKLEFKIITGNNNSDDLSLSGIQSNSSMLDSGSSSSGGNINTSMMSSSSSYGSAEEGFSSESILEQYLTLFNPYDSKLNFKIECNHPAHYALKIPTGNIEPKTEFKIKLKMKPVFLKEIRKRGSKNQSTLVEEVEQYEDAFQFKFTRIRDLKECSKIIKSNIKVVYKPTPTTIVSSTPSPLLDSTNSLNDSTTTMEIPTRIEEEKAESPMKTKIVIVEDHFQTSLLKQVDSKHVHPTITITTPPHTPPPTPNVRDSRVVEELFEEKFAESNNDVITTTTEEYLKVRSESPMTTSDSVTSDDYLQLGKKKKNSRNDDDDGEDKSSSGKSSSSDKKKLKSILKKSSSPQKEKSVKDMITDLFPLLAGLIVLVIFAKFNRVDYDTAVNMFASYLLGACAMYVQMKFNEEQ